MSPAHDIGNRPARARTDCGGHLGIPRREWPRISIQPTIGTVIVAAMNSA